MKFSFGKLLSLVSVLALIVALTCAMTLTANAESIDVFAADGDMTITVTAPYNECGKIRLSWKAVSGASKYAVYLNDEHIANSVAAYYNIGNLDVAAHGAEEITYSFKIVAIDKNGDVISFGTANAPAKHFYKDVVTLPDCLNGGYTTHTCACGDEYVDAEVEALGHDYSEWIEIVEPLCEVDGVLGHYTCSRCAVNFDAELEILESLTIPALGHSFTDYTFNNDSTCTEDGTKTAICDHGCGTTDTVIAVDTALGHSFTNYEFNNDATCTEDGTKTAACDHGCGVTDTVRAAGTALGHSFTNYVFNNDADCTTDGSETAICDNGCGTTDTKGTPGSATGHRDGDVVVENKVDPDCVTPGSYDNVIYCTACGVEVSRKNVTVDPLGHTNGDTVVENNVAPDCVTPGKYDNVICCTVCGVEVSRDTVDVDPLGHTGGTVVVENNVAPDCVTPGSYDNVIYCTVCGVEVSRDTVDVDPLGHTGGNATCFERASCEVCGESYGSVLEHSFTNYHSNGDATCTEDGTKTAQCNNGCGVLDTKADVDSKLGHTFTDYVADGNATCFEDGTKTATCDNGCGLTDTVADEGSTLGHDHVLEENPDAFILYKYCSRCGDKQKGKLQIPVPYRVPLIKGSVVLICVLIIILSIRALTRPATTTPFWRRGRYR